MSLSLFSCTDITEWIQWEEEHRPNTFDFSTTSNVGTTIQYTQFPGDVKGSVYFEIYDVNPIKDTAVSRPPLKEGVQPLYTGYTDSNGVFSGDITLPAYMDKAYVYSPNPLVTRLMTADVKNGVFSASDAQESRAATRASVLTRANNNEGYSSKAITEDGWQTLLIGNNYETSHGKLTDSFLNSNVVDTSLKLTASEHSAILTAFNSMRTDVSTGRDVGNFPSSYAKDGDIQITSGDVEGATTAQIAITMIHSATWWTSTLGYYYYSSDADKPTSYDDLKNRAIVIAPNTLTKDTGRSSTKYDKNAPGMDENTTIQLKYFGDYDRSKKEYANTEGTYDFPVGTYIGFVLYTNAWTNQAHNYSIDKVDGNRKTRAATSKACSIKSDGNTLGTSDASLTAAVTIGDVSILAFEDDVLNNEGNYTDVVFALKTTPTGVLDIDKPTNETNTSATTGGVYAFEDLWPNAGDYDMNDVIMESNGEKTSTTYYKESSKTNVVSYSYDSESLIFTVDHNYATLPNQWAVRFNNASDNGITASMIKVTKNDNAADAAITKDGDDLIVQMELVSSSSNTDKYKITINWNKVFSSSDEFAAAYEVQTDYDVFINRPEEKLEVHVPDEAPTSTVDYSLFGTGDDRTLNDNGTRSYWYTSGNNNYYPFAFFLSGATKKDIEKLLDSSNESKRIDELYPDYIIWAKTKGKESTGWYKTTSE